MPNKQNKETAISAAMTADGFIEIMELTALDEIVGGLVDPDAIVCELSEDIPRKKPESNYR